MRVCAKLTATCLHAIEEHEVAGFAVVIWRLVDPEEVAIADLQPCLFIHLSLKSLVGMFAKVHKTGRKHPSTLERLMEALDEQNGSQVLNNGRDRGGDMWVVGPIAVFTVLSRFFFLNPSSELPGAKRAIVVY
ncbi:MAG TPA: hypothetical protein PLZ95_06555 [Bryobacteraceae bacterium]|nr:hypothetical protein [Bryobacteraceae bacterium]